jgi:hypothetical protein
MPMDGLANEAIKLRPNQAVNQSLTVLGAEDNVKEELGEAVAHIGTLARRSDGLFRL